MILSVHSTSETKILGLRNFAPVFDKICFCYSSGPRARAACVDWCLLSDDFAKNLRKRQPADWDRCVSHRFPHQRYRFTEKKDLNVVTCFRKRIAVKERERSLCMGRRIPKRFS